MNDYTPVNVNRYGFKDITGQRFHYLVALKPVGVKIKMTYWLCQCDCGNQKIIGLSHLLKNTTKSCGCYRKKWKVTHGLTKGYKQHDLYQIWSGILKRCNSEKDHAYKWYGKRGIKVCNRWQHGEAGLTGLECFIKDMGNRPSKKHSIDRIDTNGDYEPSNCRWATPLEQGQNTRVCIKIIYKGKEYPSMSAFQEAFNISKSRVEKLQSRHGFTRKQAFKKLGFNVEIIEPSLN